MAILATEERMFAGKRESRRLMIKRFLVEYRRLHVSSQVILMTRYAPFYGNRKVIAAFCIDRIPDLDMTRQAFLPTNFVPNFMTLRAVVQSLQLLMST
jgi:hypothetical protein